MGVRPLFLALGVMLLLAAIVPPIERPVPLPPKEAIAAPTVDGFLLLRAALALQGLLALFLAAHRPSYNRLEPGERLGLPSGPPHPKAPRREVLWTLSIATALGVGLRFYHLDSTLWLDEITPRLDYGRASYLQLLTSFISTNNHLLYTIVSKTLADFFGEREWAIRLPAAIAGAMTVPAFYWVARSVLSRRYSLAASLMLAVSYHHVFFSQNARGYTLYLLLSSIACILLARALTQDSLRLWVVYAVVLILDLSVFMTSGFVYIAHALVGVIAVLIIWKRGENPVPLARRLIVVFGAIGLVAFDLYAAVFPSMLAYMRFVYTQSSTGFSLASVEFLQETIRGVTAGFGESALAPAAVFVALAAAGYWRLVRANWVLASALTLPPVVHAAFTVAQGLTFSPRFFLLLLPVAILAALVAAASVSSRLATMLPKVTARRLETLVAALLVTLFGLVSLRALSVYYVIPKQSYAAAIERIEALRQPSDVVVIVHYAESGFRYYGLRAGANDYIYLRCADALRQAVESNRGRRLLLVTTFQRALTLDQPDLMEGIEAGWVVQEQFPATVRDGNIQIWVPVRGKYLDG